MTSRDDVLRLGNVVADEEPVMVGPQGCLQLPESLDKGEMVRHAGQGGSSSDVQGKWMAVLSPEQKPQENPFWKLPFSPEGDHAVGVYPAMPHSCGI